MEEAPQNLTKLPKIQTEAFTTPNRKSKAKNREVGEGSKDILTRSKFSLKTPKDILKTALSQPNGVYLALAERMAEDGDWEDGLWIIKKRLVLVTVYGAKDLSRLEGKITPRNHVLDAYKRVMRKECPYWDLQKGEHLPILEEVAISIPRRNGHLNKSWALMMLPEGLLSEPFLCPENHYSGRRGDHMVLFQEFPWELPGIQAYQIFGVQTTVMDENMDEVIQGRLGAKLLGPLQVKSKVNPTSCQRVWEVTLNFIKTHKEDGQQVMGTILMKERERIHVRQR